MLSTTHWIVLLGVLAMTLVALVAIAIFSARSARRRHLEHKRGSVPEYEPELLAREERARMLHLQPLSERDRARFSADWRKVQARFVDDPSGAVAAADQLIENAMRMQGYDVEDFDQRVDDLSVDHAGVVRHYRAAHELAAANREGRADTEELRGAVVHYQALFADLLEQPVRH